MKIVKGNSPIVKDIPSSMVMSLSLATNKRGKKTVINNKNGLMGMFFVPLSHKITITLTGVSQKPTVASQKNNLVMQPRLKYIPSQKNDMNDFT